ncbi:MAG: Crp/Fnr family transcriptional regulator [Variovorax sp.]
MKSRSQRKPIEAICPARCRDCALRVNPAFLPVSLDELQAIENFRTGSRAFSAGSTICAEHRVDSELYTLYAGWAFRFKTLSDGRRQILSFLLPGDFVGLQDEFVDGQTYGVEAVTACVLCRFPRKKLWPLFDAHPRLGYAVSWLTARGEKIVDDNLLTVGRRNAVERVAMLLMHLYRRAERVGLAEDDGIDFPFNQQHIADALGLSLVHTHKTLRRLQQLGLHELKSGRLRICNAAALEQLGDYFERPMQAVPLV